LSFDFRARCDCEDRTAEGVEPQSPGFTSAANEASPDVLVLLPEAAEGIMAAEGTYATVVGTVQPYVEGRLTRAFDWFRPSRDVVMRLRARPVLIAESARTASGVTIAARESAPPVLVTNPGRITDVPGRFYGQRVLVPDATVDATPSPRTFTLDDPAYLAEQDLLVVLPPKSEAPAAVREDQTVTVRGTVRRYVATQFERDYGWFDASELGNLAAWENRPVLVADMIRPEGTAEVVLLELDWTSPTTLDGEDWWVRQTWEPLANPERGADSATTPATAAGASDATNAPPPIDLKAVLDSDNRRSLDGRALAAVSIPVQQVIGESLLLVGPAADRGVAVRVADTSGLAPGVAIAIEGTVRTVPGSLDGWHLDDEERDALGTRQVFIDATKVARAEATGR
jgi:hypothetical protein